MRTINGKVDENDIEYVSKRCGTPVVAWPAPMTRYKTGKNKGKIKANPHVTRFFYKDGRVTDVFHVKPVYYMHLDGTWRPLSEVTYHLGHRRVVLREDYQSKMHPVFLRWWMKRMELIGGGLSVPYWMPGLKSSLILNAVTTVFPDPDPETTSVDGFVYRSIASPGEVWGTIRTGAGTGFTDNATAVDSQAIGANASTTTNQWNQIVRGIYLFDTSSIPDTDSVDSATCSFFVAANSLLNIALSVRLTTSTPASNTALVAGDYGQLGTATQATSAPTSDVWDNGQPVYFDFTMNSTGLSNISKTGVSKFGTIAVEDADNTAPTWSSGAQGEAYCHKAEAAGTSNDPKLAVTHTAAAASNTFPMMLMGVG